MDINDYLIDQTGIDWSKLLAGWQPLLPPEFTVWMVNRFGEMIIVMENGSVHYMDFSANELRHIAESREDFVEKVGNDNNANDWLMIPLVDACVAAGKTLPVGKCYNFTIPVVLGGKYEVDNIAVVPLSEYYSFLADLHRQIKDLPDGTQVKLKIVD